MSRKEKLIRLLEREPNDVFLHFGLAMEFVKEGAVDEAIARFDRVLALDPAYLAAYYQKGNTLLTAGRLADAKMALVEGINAAKKAGDLHAAAETQALLDGVS